MESGVTIGEAKENLGLASLDNLDIGWCDCLFMQETDYESY